jgi:GntR family transcriptional repressor for pyruvate dehydrogenase complex
MSLSAAVLEQLTTQILDGRLPAGAALPSERALTEEFGVNRQALREALQRLDQLGLVDIRHGGATRVRDYHKTAGLDLLPRLFVKGDGTVDRGVVRSVMEMRAAIGTDAAGLCAERAVPSEVDELERVVAGLAAADPDDLTSLAALDTAFWDIVVDRSDNICYRLSFNALLRVCEPVEGVVHLLLADERGDVEGHRALAGAVASGHGERARSAARRLLARGTAAMATHLFERPRRMDAGRDRPTMDSGRERRTGGPSG